MTLEEKFAKFNIQIREANNNFRSIYDILKDISKVWYQLSEKEQTELCQYVIGYHHNKDFFEKYYII